MKMDMNAAWADTVTMLKSNTDVLGIVAAVFFFLPALALAILAPGTELEAALASDNPNALGPAFAAYFANSWLVLLIYGLITIVGTLAVFALFGQRSNPTVGEAISAGLKGFLPYLATALIIAVVAAIAAMLIGVIAAATGIFALVMILGIVLAVVLIVVSIRVVLAGPVIAIEGENNPIAALTRSWKLVKGNTRRVFLFIFLLAIAIGVVSLVFGFLFAGIGALMGPTAALWIEGILGSMLSAITTLVMLAVYTAIYRQVAGEITRSELETFE